MSWVRAGVVNPFVSIQFNLFRDYRNRQEKRMKLFGSESPTPVLARLCNLNTPYGSTQSDTYRPIATNIGIPLLKVKKEMISLVLSDF